MTLHDLVETYIAYKRSLGMRYRSQVAVLRAYCRVMGDVAVEEVRPEAALAFIAGTGPVTARWREYHRVLGGFYRYAISRGFATESPLPTKPAQTSTSVHTVRLHGRGAKALVGGHQHSANTPIAAAGLDHAHSAAAALRHGDAHRRGPGAHFARCRSGEPRADGA
jgi:hypothetical protein